MLTSSAIHFYEDDGSDKVLFGSMHKGSIMVSDLTGVKCENRDNGIGKVLVLLGNGSSGVEHVLRLVGGNSDSTATIEEWRDAIAKLLDCNNSSGGNDNRD